MEASEKVAVRGFPVSSTGDLVFPPGDIAQEGSGYRLTLGLNNAVHRTVDLAACSALVPVEDGTGWKAPLWRPTRFMTDACPAGQSGADVRAAFINHLRHRVDEAWSKSLVISAVQGPSPAYAKLRDWTTLSVRLVWDAEFRGMVRRAARRVDWVLATLKYGWTVKDIPGIGPVDVANNFKTDGDTVGLVIPTPWSVDNIKAAVRVHATRDPDVLAVFHDEHGRRGRNAYGWTMVYRPGRIEGLGLTPLVWLDDIRNWAIRWNKASDAAAGETDDVE